MRLVLCCCLSAARHAPRARRTPRSRSCLPLVPRTRRRTKGTRQHARTTTHDDEKMLRAHTGKAPDTTHERQHATTKRCCVPTPVVAKRQNWWAAMTLDVHHSWRPSTSENNFLSRNLAEPVADARLCCARAPAHRHAAPRRPRSELLTWQRLRCPKGSCIGKRGEGRWWVRSPANSRTSFSKRQKDYRKFGTEFR